MKILWVDHYDEYLSPNEKYYSLIAKNLNADFFGPGFSSDEELKQGLHHYIEKKSGFDLIVTGIYPNSDNNPQVYRDELYENLVKYRYLHYSKSGYSSISKISNELYEINNIPIIYRLKADTYSITKTFLAPLKKENIYTIAAGKQFTKWIDTKSTKIKESFSKDINNNFYDFVNEYDSKIISFFHTLGEDEFKFNSLENREYDISVLGVLYNSRKGVLKNISNVKYKTPSTIHKHIYSFLNKIGINVYSNYIFLSLYNLIFRYYLFNSKFSYTCGSELDTLVRKFFEIPAHGAILITKDIFWLRDLGFKHGENFLAIERAEEILDILSSFEDNMDEMQQIANKGQSLIYENHTVGARTIQLKNVFEEIVAGNYYGSYWKNGKFILREKNKNET